MIPTEHLRRIILEVAVERFGNAEFGRAQLRDAVEECLRANEMWEPTDDAPSKSTDPKSRGQANIDYRISDLASLHLISNVRRNCWTVGVRGDDDEEDSPPDRIPTTVLRTVRDTALARLIKEQCGHLCQVCREPLALPNGRLYVEAHHLRPLARRHGGLDRADNIIVLCPNHHALFDLGAPEFPSPTTVRIADHDHVLTPTPQLSQSNIDYHNTTIRRLCEQAAGPNGSPAAGSPFG